MKTSIDITKRWKRLAIAMAICCIVFSIIGLCVADMATRSLSDHRNLYYNLWRCELRGYDESVALRGMFHDRKFRESLKGLTKEEFEEIFPNTFFEIKNTPPSAVEGRTYYSDRRSLFLSKEPIFSFIGWVAVFENGLLVELEWEKGV